MAAFENHDRSTLDAGMSFLILHGLLQVLVQQQDAVDRLCEIVGCQIADADRVTAKLKSVRNLRNDITGHPANRGGGRCQFVIQRGTQHQTRIGVYCFDALGHMAFRELDLVADCIIQQRKVVKTRLDDIKSHLTI